MANLGGLFGGNAFDANSVEPSTPFAPLPAGDYPAWITKSEMKDTSTGGQQLVLEFAILDGEAKDKKLWDRLNLVNTGPKAQQTMEIAQRTLSAICRAAGVMNLQDSEQLHGIPMLLKVAVEVHGQDKNLPPGTQRLVNAVKGYSTFNNDSGLYQQAQAPRLPPNPNTNGGGAYAQAPQQRPQEPQGQGFQGYQGQQGGQGGQPPMQGMVGQGGGGGNAPWRRG
jgi:hypothetical protein